MEAAKALDEFSTARAGRENMFLSCMAIPIPRMSDNPPIAILFLLHCIRFSFHLLGVYLQKYLAFSDSQTQVISKSQRCPALGQEVPVA
jgi:hypothetical protein